MPPLPLLLWRQMLGFVIVLAFGALASSSGARNPTARFPLQLVAEITITAHQIPADSEFPPRTRSLRIAYDYVNKKCRADIAEGYEAAKVYVRRYDLKTEYMHRLPPINDCKRSHLFEVMPFPDIAFADFQGVQTIDEMVVMYFLHEEGDIRLHMYFDKETGAPRRLLEEAVEDGTSVPMLTYDYSDVALGPPEETMFEIPEPFTHGSCDRHVGGFPYIHAFHYFVRF